MRIVLRHDPHRVASVEAAVMGAQLSEADFAFRDRVEDRDPDTGYSHSEWLVPRPFLRRTDDWLDAAFALAGDPSKSGKFRPRHAS